MLHPVAGVPAKMSTRENVHLTILRQRILIRRQNSPVKCSRENVHQPRTPNSLHFAHAVHFAHGLQNLLLSFDCTSDWFWQGFFPLSDQNLPRQTKKQCLVHSSFSSCSLFDFSPFQRNAHEFAVTISQHTGDAGAIHKTLASTGVIRVLSCTAG